MPFIVRSLLIKECANCQEYGYDCTYVEAAKRRGPPKGYIDTLEQRCGRLEGVLQRLHPGFDYTSIVGPLPDRDSFDSAAYQAELNALHIPAYPAIKRFSPPTPRAVTSPSGSSPAAPILGPEPWKPFERDPNRPLSDSDHMAEQHQAMVHAITKLEVKDVPLRFHGRASAHHLVLTLSELRRRQGLPVDSNNWIESVQRSQRPIFWRVPPWEMTIANDGQRSVDFSSWPSPDLARRLIEAYFTYHNLYFPLLNKNVFEKQYKAELFRNHSDFAKVCLMVFANGARHVDDERVYWSAEEDESFTQDPALHQYSAGWHWLRASLKVGRSIMKSPNLFDFQAQVLTCLFLQGATLPHLGWIVSGLGLRSAQELGIHVRSILQKADPVERALYNRAFWCLYHIDRYNCAAIGRSVALQDSDFDADYPIEVDDQFWETGDPKHNFIQPPEAGISKISAFVHLLKLDHIIGATLRTIYAINKEADYQADHSHERSVVIQLDSALNSWADVVPDDLRWDPNRKDEELFLQSALLYCYYYYCQILIHRPYIPTSPEASSTGMPSLAICCNAARTIANIADTVIKRRKRSNKSRHITGSCVPVHYVLPTWTSAAVLLVSIYSGKQQSAERERSVADVLKCLATLRELEKTWRQAGKLVDVLADVSKDLDSLSGPGAPTSGSHGQKRGVDEVSFTDNLDGKTTNAPQDVFGAWPGPTDLSFANNFAPSSAFSPFMPSSTQAPNLDSLFDPMIFEPYPQQASEPLPNNINDDLWSQLIAGYM